MKLNIKLYANPTHLSLRKEIAEHGGCHGLLHARVGAHNQRTLAAQLECDRLDRYGRGTSALDGRACKWRFGLA
jgi:hypothetical protein